MDQTPDGAGSDALYSDPLGDLSLVKSGRVAFSPARKESESRHNETSKRLQQKKEKLKVRRGKRSRRMTEGIKKPMCPRSDIFLADGARVVCMFVINEGARQQDNAGGLLMRQACRTP